MNNSRKKKPVPVTENVSLELEHALNQSQDRFHDLVSLCCDFYWEQDEHFRFTLLKSAAFDENQESIQSLLGKTRWEIGGTPLADGGKWDKHKALLDSGAPFTDYRFQRNDPVLGQVYLSTSGIPVFDNAGKMKGYRGITRDVTREEREARFLQLENRVTRVLADADNFEQTLKTAIQAICESQGWHTGNFWKVDEAAGMLCYATGWDKVNTNPVEWIHGGTDAVQFTPDTGLPGLVWQNAEPLWIADIKQEKRVSRQEFRLGATWNSAFLFPVKATGKVIGVLDFYADNIPEPDTRLLQVIQILATEIGHFHQRAQALEQLRDSEARFRSLTELSSDWYWETDADYRFCRFEGRDSEFINGLRQQFIAKRGWETEIEIEGGNERNLMQELMDARETFRDIIMRRRLDDGTVRYTTNSGEPVFDASGRFTGYRGLSRDITRQKQAEEHIRHLATHDRLTNLPNREMLSHLIDNAIETARRYDRRFALLFIDLDGFKFVNDTVGHAGGDKLLVEIANRLKQCLRASDVVARMGGDEFVLLINEVREEAQVAQIAENLLTAVVQPMEILGQECRISASIGICMYSEHTYDEATLMKHADMAMYLAKDKGRNNYQYYSGEITAWPARQINFENDLCGAIERNELFLHYQAKVGITSGEIHGVEALLRWNHPVYGLIPPHQFIPVAENTGLMVSIGKWVFRTCCEQIVKWQQQGLPAVCVSINLSFSQFTDPYLLNDLAAVLHATGIAPGLLEIEINENILLHQTELIIDRLEAIKQLGVRIAVTNFGMGYSVLTRLKHIKIDTIKVDKSFINQITANTRDTAIIQAIITLGKALGVNIIAEGVESAEQQSSLSQLACDELQGYYFNKPGSADEFAAMYLAYLPSPRT